MTFKILSLDGGGMRGVISAQILKEIEKTVWEKHGQKLHEYFDLIAGTSTGSILAAGIACGIPANQLIKFYEDEGKNIFLESVRRQRNIRWLSRLFGSIGLYPHKKGEDKGLANVLKKQLKLRDNKGEVINQSHFPTMADIEKTQLLILAYDVKSRNTTWFANDDSEDACWWYDNTKLWEICTASASAPTFFPPYAFDYPKYKDGLPHIDGGVSANNPTVAAIAHALCIKEDDEKRKTRIKKPKTIDEIAVLSIGTGQTTRSYEYKDIKNWGLLKWVENIPNIFLDPSAENSEHISKRIFLGKNSNNYLRLNFKLEEEKKSIIRKINEFFLGRIEQNIDIYKFRIEENIDNDKFKIEKDIDIDNPEICDELIDAAKGYLCDTKVQYDGKKISVQDAIDKFFYNVEHPNKNKDNDQKQEKNQLAGV